MDSTIYPLKQPSLFFFLMYYWENLLSSHLKYIVSAFYTRSNVTSFSVILEREFKKHDDRNWNRRDVGRGRGRGGPMMYVLTTHSNYSF